ncbi:MAG: hypothetical protein RLO21_08695, partial [Nitratireductor sp.]
STSVTRRSRSHLAIWAFVLSSGSASAADFFFAAGFFAVAFFEAGPFEEDMGSPDQLLLLLEPGSGL